MQHVQTTLLAGLGRRALLPIALVSACAAPLFAQSRSEAAVKADIALARGLAEEWQYVDLAEQVIGKLEDEGLSKELNSEVGLVKCEVYASAARRERDGALRDELFGQAAYAYSEYIRANPQSEFISQAQRGYVDVCNMSGLSLEKRLEEALGEEAEELKDQIRSVLEEALRYTSELKDDLRMPSAEWPSAMKAEWSRVMFSRAQMYHTLARISEEGAFNFAQAEGALEDLAVVVGERTPPGLTAYLELASVYLSQARPRDASDFAMFVVDTAWPIEESGRDSQGFDQLTAEDKARRWTFVEKGTSVLTESMSAAGYSEDAVLWGLHMYNTWRQEGLSLSPDGYLSLLAVARTMLDSGGYIGGNTAMGDLVWYETAEEMNDNHSRRQRRSALDLALSIAQTVNTENRGNILQVRAQKMISDVISRPGVQVASDVLFEAAQGELNNDNHAGGVAGMRRVMRSLEGQDDAARAEFGGRVSYYIGEGLRKQDRMLEAMLAYREGCTTWDDPEFNERNARNYYNAARDLRSTAPGVKEYEDHYLKAEALVIKFGENDTGTIEFTQAKRVYDREDFTQARQKFLAIADGPIKDKAITYAALCLRKLKDNDGAAREFDEYLTSWITDAKNQATTPKALGYRKEATGMATYYLGAIEYERAAGGRGDYDKVIARLGNYNVEHAEQTSYAPSALYMVVLSQLAKLDLPKVQEAHDRMVEAFPDNKFTGAAATKIFNALLAQREKVGPEANSPDTARYEQLSREMARYIQLSNRLDSTPNFANLRTESSLWKELGENETAETVLKRIIQLYQDDAKRAGDLTKFVKPDLGEVLLAQKRAEEAFAILDELVPDPDDEDDDRKPSSRVVEAWCRSVVGWVESSEEGRQLTPIPGVGGEENLGDACSYWVKLTEAVARDYKWENPWYERYFETAYAYYQWGQVDSERTDAAKRQLETLRTDAGDNLELIEDEELRRKLMWLWGKVR